MSSLPPDGDAGDTLAGATVTERVRAMIELEATWLVQGLDKESAVRARFGCSLADYNSELSRVIDDPAVLEVNPLVVHRLRRNRLRRRRSMVGGTEPPAIAVGRR